jgi:hypothetical protein
MGPSSKTVNSTAFMLSSAEGSTATVTGPMSRRPKATGPKAMAAGERAQASPVP